VGKSALRVSPAYAGKRGRGSGRLSSQQGGSPSASFINVKEGVVPDAGHWPMDEQPAATVKLVLDLLSAGQ